MPPAAPSYPRDGHELHLAFLSGAGIVVAVEAVRSDDGAPMKRSVRAVVLALGPAGIAAVLVASCGGSTSRASGGADSGGAEGSPGEGAAPEAGAGDAPSDHATSDASDAGAEATVIPGTNFAMRHYYLGDTDRAGVNGATAWQSFGTNVDGKVTTAQSTDVCTLTAGAAKSTQVDGPGGIDNSWRDNNIPNFETILGTGFSASYNASVDGGAFTTMIDVTGLTGDPAQSGSAPGWGFVGASFGGPPTWKTADDWPVYPDWLVDGSLASGSKIAFSAGSIDGGTWSIGAPTELPFQLGFGGVGVVLVIHQATVSFVHATPSTAAGGNIGGVLETQELVDALNNAAGWLAVGLCSGSAIGSIDQQLEQAQDILSDGTNVAGQSCDAISIGLGFDGVQIGAVRQVTFPEQPLPNICPEAGGD